MFWFKTIKELKRKNKELSSEITNVHNNFLGVSKTLRHTQNVNKGIIDYVELYTKPVTEFKHFTVKYISTEARVNGKLIRIDMGIKAINILDAYVEAYRIVNENERERILEIVSISTYSKL